MSALTNKIKIIILIAGFCIFAVFMFLYGYKILGSKNQANTDAAIKRKSELEILLREQKSFEQGKKDLAELEKASYPPDELFSSDTKLVKEIQQLESAAQLYSLDLEIQISGTTQLAPKVPGTLSELYAVPYRMNIEGSSENVTLFMQAIEKLPFVTHTNKVSVTVPAAGKTNTVLTSEFYIKK